MSKIINKLAILALPTALGAGILMANIESNSYTGLFSGSMGSAKSFALVKGTNTNTTAKVVSKKSAVKAKANAKKAVKKKDPIIAYEINGLKNDIYITKPLLLSGYATSKDGIKSASIYLDDMTKPVKKLKLGLPSNNAALKYPKYYKSGKSGFEYSINPSKIKLTSTAVERYGVHNLKIEFVSNKGNVISKEYKVEFGKPEAVITQTGIQNLGEVSNKDIEVKGSFMAPAGSEKIVVTMDGKAVEGLATGIKSTKNFKKYVDFPNAMTSDYKLKISKNSVKRGEHLLAVSYYSNDNLVKTDNIKFNMTKPMYIIEPKETKYSKVSYGDKAILGGKIYHPSGIASVRTYVDGVEKGVVTFDKSAYSSDIDATLWGLSQKNYEVIVSGNDGEVFSITGSVGAKGVSYAQMQNTLSYYVDYQQSKGINVGPIKFTVKASNEDIIKNMDPNALMNDPQYKYVFLKLSYFEGINVSSINKLLEGKGILSGQGAAFIKAGKQYNVNPVYLVSHALHETGNGTSRLANGIEVSEIKYLQSGKAATVPVTNKKKVYNMYGVGAFDSDPLRYGSSTAYTGGDQLSKISLVGTNEYNKAINGDFAWDTPEKAIIGGAKFISLGYVNNTNFEGNYQQNTLYKMKWDFKACDLNLSWAHQYATDVAWATKQTKRIKELIDTMGDVELQYEVPIFR